MGQVGRASGLRAAPLITGTAHSPADDGHTTQVRSAPELRAVPLIDDRGVLAGTGAADPPEPPPAPRPGA